MSLKSMFRFVSLSVVTGFIVWAGYSAHARWTNNDAGGLTLQERQCVANGWRRVVVDVDGDQRVLFWKGPADAWTKGAIIVMHGGGGEYFHWCAANSRLIAPQVAFSDLALSEGFAVLSLDSTDRVADNEGRICGKIWDDEVRDRPNIDLPFIGKVIHKVIPALRPESSRGAIFLTGLSSGGYMTVRAATHFDNAITAFAPVSSGDPYGWRRTCEPGLTRRTKVHGAGFDNETGKQIIERDACLADTYPHERTWDTTVPAIKPAFRVFHHAMDGINDISCGEKVERLLRQHGYPGTSRFHLDGGRRRLANHLWQDAYNRPMLEFFESRLGDVEK